eukprot:Phypoly_transcript_15834.p1 GENE.Phypoly_transcript_15834~~Phypoly_transcript_15834.p1  ORF type:complete len:289 (+),score=28.31 Phypoly_transcript_15834:108-869(+)
MKALKERLLERNTINQTQPSLERRQSWRVGPHTTLSVAATPVKRLPKPNPIINPTIIRHLFVLSLAWQIANVSIIVLTDWTQSNSSKFDVALAIMLLFQTLHITLVIGTSIKLCKQVLHRTASPMFVVQSFLSTTLLYAGLFTLINRADQDAFTGFSQYANQPPKPLATIQIFIKFWYFSTATMTTVGYGDVTPTTWYTQLIVTTEMLLSVTFTVVIFAQGLSHFNTPLILEHEHATDNQESPLPTPKTTTNR